MNEHLGPLPTSWRAPIFDGRERLYTADQMRAYAAQEVAAERERCAQLCLAARGERIDIDDNISFQQGYNAACEEMSFAIRNPVLP